MFYYYYDVSHYTVGKEVMAKGPNIFHHEASEAYKRLSNEVRESLENSLPESSTMTKSDISKRATTIFHKITKSVIIISLFMQNTLY